MNIFILDKDFNLIAPVDEFISFLWTDRYYECGDYELILSAEASYRKYLVDGNYLYKTDSDRLMFIESIELKSNFEDGDRFISKGRSIESVLERRLIWGYANLTGKLQNSLKRLLNQNAISPSNAKRKLPYLTFKDSTDQRILDLEFEGQFFGDNLYDVIVSMAKAYGFGWRIIPNLDTKVWTMEFYMGVDYSYAQNVRPWVVFSEAYENLSDSNYFHSKKEYKTAAMVGGEGEGNAQEFIEVFRKNDDGGSGLDRREVYVSARGSSYDSELTEEQRKARFKNEMIQTGRDTLAETDQISAYDGVIELTQQFEYGKDFTLGDIVQIINAYGMESSSRVSEIISSYDENGYSTVPSFEVVVQS